MELNDKLTELIKSMQELEIMYKEMERLKAMSPYCDTLTIELLMFDIVRSAESELYELGRKLVK